MVSSLSASIHALRVDLDRELALEGGRQRRQIPLLLDALARHVIVDDGIDDLGADPGDGIGDVLRRHELGALLVDDLALVVGDVVVLEQVLAQIEVVGFDLALCALDLAREHLALDDLAFLHTGGLQPALGAVRIAEDPHQVVFERQIEPARARIALPAGAAAELVVDAPRLVPLGAHDVQPARGHDLLVTRLPVGLRRGARRLVVGRYLLELGLGVAAQHDVGAATGHVGRDRDRARAARLRDDDGLALVLLRVQHLVLDAVLVEQPREEFRGLDRGRADQRGLLAGDAVADVLDDRLVLVLLREVDEVGVIGAHHRLVRRDHDDFEPVDLLELEGLGVGRARHARELAVHAEVVLEGDRGDRLVLLAHAHALPWPRPTGADRPTSADPASCGR